MKKIEKVSNKVELAVRTPPPLSVINFKKMKISQNDQLFFIISEKIEN